jgi:hypothetical protein
MSKVATYFMKNVKSNYFWFLTLDVIVIIISGRSKLTPFKKKNFRCGALALVSKISLPSPRRPRLATWPPLSPEAEIKINAKMKTHIFFHDSMLF